MKHRTSRTTYQRLVENKGIFYIGINTDMLFTCSLRPTSRTNNTSMSLPGFLTTFFDNGTNESTRTETIVTIKCNRNLAKRKNEN